MSEAIIVAIISLIGTFMGAFSGFRLVSYRVEQLEKKVEKHNNFAERIPLMELRLDKLEQHPTQEDG